MGAGLLQLQFTSDHGTHFIGNPQITFFQVVYRR